MPPVFVPFDGWSPSKSVFGEGWEMATNLYPSFEAWRPWRRFGGLGDIADGPMTGRHAHLWNVTVTPGTYAPDKATLFTGSPTKLYVVDQDVGTFTNVSRAALYTATGGGWRFASVGNDIWATNWLDPLQRRTNNAGLFANGVVSTFKPQPRFIATVREHMLAANLSNAGRFLDEVVWSDADDTTNYDPATGTSTSLAGNKRLTSIQGQITGLVGGQYALAFKRDCIYYLEYTGTTQVFRPDVLSSNVGTSLPSSIIDSRYGRFFLGPDGFYQISGLGAPTKLPMPGVDQYLLDSFFSDRPSSYPIYQEDMQIYGFQMKSMPLVGWMIRRNWDFLGSNLALFYNPLTSSWSHGQVAEPEESAATAAVTVPVELPPAGGGVFTLGSGLYTVLGAFTWTPSLAVSEYAPLIGGVYAPTMSLRYRPANFESANEYQQSMIQGIMPVFSKETTATPTLTSSITVESLLDPGQTSAASETRVSTDRNMAGWYPFQIAGRFFRITINGTQDEDFGNFEGAWVDQRLLT